MVSLLLEVAVVVVEDVPKSKSRTKGLFTFCWLVVVVVVVLVVVLGSKNEEKSRMKELAASSTTVVEVSMGMSNVNFSAVLVTTTSWLFTVGTSSMNYSAAIFSTIVLVVTWVPRSKVTVLTASGLGIAGISSFCTFFIYATMVSSLALSNLMIDCNTTHCLAMISRLKLLCSIISEESLKISRVGRVEVRKKALR